MGIINQTVDQIIAALANFGITPESYQNDEDEIRTKLLITQRSDKWGNIVTPNGTPLQFSLSSGAVNCWVNGNHICNLFVTYGSDDWKIELNDFLPGGRLDKEFRGRI